LFYFFFVRSSEFKDMARNDGKKRDVAKTSWAGVAAKIRKVLHTFAADVVQNPADRHKYFLSGQYLAYLFNSP